MAMAKAAQAKERQDGSWPSPCTSSSTKPGTSASLIMVSRLATFSSRAAGTVGSPRRSGAADEPTGTDGGVGAAVICPPPAPARLPAGSRPVPGHPDPANPDPAYPDPAHPSPQNLPPAHPRPADPRPAR